MNENEFKKEAASFGKQFKPTKMVMLASEDIALDLNREFNSDGTPVKSTKNKQ